MSDFTPKNIGRSDFAQNLKHIFEGWGDVEAVLAESDLTETGKNVIRGAQASAERGFTSYKLYFMSLGTMYDAGLIGSDYSFVQYQHDAMRTSILETDEDHINYGVLNTASEAGEIAGKFAKSLRDKTELDNEAVMKEMGDVLWSLAALAKGMGVTLEDVAAMNVSKLRSRQANNTIEGSGDDR